MKAWRSRAKLLIALAVVVIVGLVGSALLDLRSMAIGSVSQSLGQPLHIDGGLTFRPGFKQLTVRFAGLHIDQPAWAGPGAIVWVDKGAVELPWSDLFGNRRILSVTLDGLHLKLRRDRSGRATWSRKGGTGRPPDVDAVVISNGTLDYEDLSRAVTFHAAINTSDAAAAQPVLNIVGAGRVKGAAWSAAARGDARITASAPYGLTLNLTLNKPTGRSVASFTGRVSLAAVVQVTGLVEAQGPDLHDLAHLTNTPLPTTPPYHLRTPVDATARAIRLQALAGRMGASDVEGMLTISPDGAGRRLDGDLHSNLLRISDLLTIVSAGRLTHGRRAPGHILPDAPISIVPLSKLAGEIRYGATRVQAPTTPRIRSLKLVAAFDHGRVAADPFSLVLAQGAAVVRVVLDGRSATPRIELSAIVQRADVLDFMQPAQATPPILATFDGAVQLHGAGASLSQAAAHAFGSLRLHILSGRMQPVQASVLSGDFGRALIALLSKRDHSLRLQCAVANFEVSNGQARSTNLQVGTDLGVVSGYGGFNLGSETIDFTLRPKTSALSVTSVRIEGPLARPRTILALDKPPALVHRALAAVLHNGVRSDGATPNCE